MSATKIEEKNNNSNKTYIEQPHQTEEEKNYNKTQKRYKYNTEREGVEAPKNVEQ